jgi:hypothetical protein
MLKFFTSKLRVQRRKPLRVNKLLRVETIDESIKNLNDVHAGRHKSNNIIIEEYYLYPHL